MLADLQKWDTDVKKIQHLLLFLDGDAFLVFRRMSDADKKKPDAVKARLQEAFAVSRAQAYELFKTRTLRVDESIDAYAADLQRLLALSGHESAGDADKDPVLWSSFWQDCQKIFRAKFACLSLVARQA